MGPGDARELHEAAILPQHWVLVFLVDSAWRPGTRPVGSEISRGIIGVLKIAEALVPHPRLVVMLSQEQSRDSWV